MSSKVNKIFNTDEEFRNGVEDVCNRLTRWFGPNMVNGKKTFYQISDLIVSDNQNVLRSSLKNNNFLDLRALEDFVKKHVTKKCNRKKN